MSTDVIGARGLASGVSVVCSEIDASLACMIDEGFGWVAMVSMGGKISCREGAVASGVDTGECSG